MRSYADIHSDLETLTKYRESLQAKFNVEAPVIDATSQWEHVNSTLVKFSLTWSERMDNIRYDLGVD